MLGFLVPFFGLIKLILERIFKYKDEKFIITYEKDKQKMEDAIARGNAADITAMFDDLRKPSGQDNISRQGSKEVT